MEFLKAKARRVVIKIGTNSLIHADGHLLNERMDGIAAQIAALRTSGLEVVLVSSGAVGVGLRTLALADRPTDLAGLQACAAIGQPRLMAAWDRALAQHQLRCAQVLLTREDVRGRRRHLAARSTLDKLISLGAIPIINENDTISADEIKFGDNDILSAMVASLLQADLLVILSTIPGLMQDQGKGALIPLVEHITPELLANAGGAANKFSTGGMVTKLEAAQLATQSGCGMFIGCAATGNILIDILKGTATGTFFLPAKLSMAARKRWIAFFQPVSGQLFLDPGAVCAIRDKKTSLLARGISRFEGRFEAGDIVNLHDPNGQLVARGICTYSAADLQRITGKSSSEIQSCFPERHRLEVVHRDSLVLLN